MSSKSNGNRKRGRPRGRRNRKRKTPLALQMHNFVERATIDNEITINTEASATMMAKTFQLQNMLQYSAYADLFEYYRINKIVVTFRYKANGKASASYNTQNEINPLLYWKVDHDDVDNTTLAHLKESMKTKTHQLSNSKPNFSITLKPAIQAEAYRTSLTTGYAPKWGQWLRTSDGAIPHYGLKVYAIAHKDANFDPGTITVEYKYYVSMKNND